MSMLFFTFRAQLRAQKALKLLYKQGISARLGKTPGALALNGCGYGLWVDADWGKNAAEYLKSADLRYEKCYRTDNGRLKEVSL